ncbi:MltA domain-containing protein [Aureimonas sp. ME7]|uniref:murein transglycosylase A n=1 Tax=Aureimonas sp. ME7 TaxID=2744252 RepID=UPI0015F649D6|nr:MltA domain-containing protein [Aureimonas sp. ME7]
MSASTPPQPDASWRRRFAERSFDTLAGWRDADPRPAFAAFLRSAPSILRADTASARSGLGPAHFAPAAERALEAKGPPTQREARTFFERFFRPFAILDGGAPAPGFLTGYYEPELPASRERSARFSVPLYRTPGDLVRLPTETRLDGMDGETRFAWRAEDGRLRPYPDRAAIDGGWLRGRGLELVWLENPVDAFFVHIQGSARLSLPGGETMRVGYDAKNGHRFTAIGRVLVSRGALPLEEADMAGIRRWLAAHPGETQALLHQNRSFIFFREVEAREGEGPIGGAGVPLTPLGSLAVDAAIHPYGMPVFVDAPGLAIEDRPFRRLVVAQDTGSAILGPARGDLFVGSGLAAGAIAGAIRHPAAFTALLPVALAEAGR